MDLTMVQYWLMITWIWLKIIIKILDTWSSFASLSLTSILYAEINIFCPTAQHQAAILPILWTLLYFPIWKYFLTQMKGQNWMLFWKRVLQMWYWTLVVMREENVCWSSCHKIELTTVVCFILRAFNMLIMLNGFLRIIILPKIRLFLWRIERMNWLINHRQSTRRLKRTYYSKCVKLNWVVYNGDKITVRRAC